jgi:hypothetical protein
VNTILKEIINVLITERAVLRVERNTTTSTRIRDLDLARNSISGKRITFDELLQNIPDVRFFVSAITAIQATSEQDRGIIFAAVSFFIVDSPSDDCSEEIIFDALNNEDPEVNVVRIRPRQPGDGDSLAHVLFNVVKNKIVFLTAATKTIVCTEDLTFSEPRPLVTITQTARSIYDRF